MLRHLTLVENNMLAGIDSGREERGGDLARIAPQFVRVLPNGNRVQVDHAVNAIMGILHLDEPPDRAEIVSEVEIARRLNARKYPRTNGSHRTIPVVARLYARKIIWSQGPVARGETWREARPTSWRPRLVRRRNT